MADNSTEVDYRELLWSISEGEDYSVELIGAVQTSLEVAERNCAALAEGRPFGGSTAAEYRRSALELSAEAGRRAHMVSEYQRALEVANASKRKCRDSYEQALAVRADPVEVTFFTYLGEVARAISAGELTVDYQEVKTRLQARMDAEAQQVFARVKYLECCDEHNQAFWIIKNATEEGEGNIDDMPEVPRPLPLSVEDGGGWRGPVRVEPFPISGSPGVPAMPGAESGAGDGTIGGSVLPPLPVPLPVPDPGARLPAPSPVLPLPPGGTTPVVPSPSPAPRPAPPGAGGPGTGVPGRGGPGGAGAGAAGRAGAGPAGAGAGRPGGVPISRALMGGAGSTASHSPGQQGGVVGQGARPGTGGPAGGAAGRGTAGGGMVGGGAGSPAAGGTSTEAKKRSDTGPRRPWPRAKKKDFRVEGSEASRARDAYEQDRARRRAFGSGDAAVFGQGGQAVPGGPSYTRDAQGNITGIYEPDDDDWEPKPWGPVR